MKNHHFQFRLILVFLFACGSFAQLQAQSQPVVSPRDHLFAPTGGSNLTLACGVPLNGALEYAYGISDKVTVGVFAGTNVFADFEGYGLRVRNIIAQKEDLRIYLETPVILYPETRRARKPWFLVYPTVLAEKRFPSGLRLAAGTGLLAGGCLEPLIGKKHEMSEEEHAHMVERGECTFGGRGSVMGAMWSTLNTSVAVPLSPKMMYFLKLDVVVAGIGVGEMRTMPWLWNPPVIGVTGFAYNLSGGRSK